MKELNIKNRNFDRSLDKLIRDRKNKIFSSTNKVTKIIQDVKKNGDSALIKYEKDLIKIQI